MPPPLPSITLAAHLPNALQNLPWLVHIPVALALVAGLTLGCFNAWHWVAKEDRAIRHEQEDNGD